jgi:hypothetical protein
VSPYNLSYLNLIDFNNKYYFLEKFYK